MSLGRRQFLAGAALGITTLLVNRVAAQDQTGATSGGADLLRDPASIGRPRDPRSPLDNDPTIIAIERKLRCTCGCTLDIYTCRTTDFSCTFSPALHREIMAMYSAGEDPEAIVQALVDREGPQMLMAPPATGMNLIAGYLLPGMVVATAVLLLTAWLTRRREPPVATVATGPESTAPSISAADAERLKKALEEVES